MHLRRRSDAHGARTRQPRRLIPASESLEVRSVPTGGLGLAGPEPEVPGDAPGWFMSTSVGDPPLPREEPPPLVPPTINGITVDRGVLTLGATSDSTPTLIGSADYGATVRIEDGSRVLGTAIVNIDGTWSFTTPELADGGHIFLARVVAADDRMSRAAGPLTISVDTAAPAAPALDALVPDPGLQGVIDQRSVRLSGTTEAGATVIVSDGSTILGNVRAGADGTWTFTTPILSYGQHVLSVSARDSVGNAGPSTTPRAVDIVPAPVFVVQGGQTQRSYLRQLALAGVGGSGQVFSQSKGNLRLVSESGRTVLPLHDAMVRTVGDVLVIDFGPQGIAARVGGRRDTMRGDGAYALQIDLNGDGAFADRPGAVGNETFRVTRTLGDVNGDGRVNASDLRFAAAGVGTSYNPNRDVNGDGKVNRLDVQLIQAAARRRPGVGIASGGR